MTALVWDAVGEKRYETGLDRGVLYLPEGGGVAWNGLTEVTESRSQDVRSYYTDGIKYLDHQVLGAFSGQLKAFTYPDELNALTGVSEFEPGVVLYDQPVRTFGLSYRTKVGDDVNSDLGYVVHLLYNILATPADPTFASIGKTVVPNVFTWKINGVPPLMIGARPTAHVALHSRAIDPDLLETLEETLYGTVSTDPELPGLVALLEQVEEFYA